MDEVYKSDSPHPQMGLSISLLKYTIVLESEVKI